MVPPGARSALATYEAPPLGSYKCHWPGGPDSSEIVQLTDEPGYDGQPGWSPDGQSLAFVSDRDGNLEIYILEFSGD